MIFRVKICGVRLHSDIEAVAAAGGDAIGLNFFPPSIRYVDPDDPRTQELSAAAAGLGLFRVGVFVNEAPARIAEIADVVGLDAIQLHGDETVESASQVSGRKLRAIKLPTGPLTVSQIDAASRLWIEAGYHVLFDADAGAAHGGSGKTLDWNAIAAWASLNPSVAWTLAGGLTPDNLSDAIQASSATSVDTASGVESPKGTKSSELIQAFCSVGQ
ncbi:phosphoribosylanthranilate isomerase [Rubripirellula reticaptiva]|uniref:N-(5'-phosphoribosyl)anthranilate isomerase n=1 Tax=Rubripirellula reticaptiva TaxID=2528013 RepID=A0A5C6EDC8_9BACT|nr:phosphoribosylanthranilate isomerase [Rubripirellula reticaptiva]TWU47703.1 N-(5'-phosphoribosyl)anthranilate isomerase [Rubripirellula reticaptiva]